MPRHLHDWKPHPEKPKHAICDDCGKVDYISNLSSNWQDKVEEMKAQPEEEIPTIEPEPEPEPDFEEPTEEVVDEETLKEVSEMVTLVDEEDVKGAIGDELEEEELEEPTLEVEPVDLLMWVGSRHYAKPIDFINEAKNMGASKRVPMPPRAVVPGKSRVFCVHDDAVSRYDPDRDEFYTIPGVFGYYTVRSIVKVVAPGTDIEAELEARGVDTYEMAEGDFGDLDERGCGSLEIGGTYLISEEDMHKVRDMEGNDLLEGHFVVLDDPIPVDIKRLRGYKHVDGNAILSGEPEDEWYESAHRTYLENKKRMRRFKRQFKKYQAALEDDEE